MLKGKAMLLTAVRVLTLPSTRRVLYPAFGCDSEGEQI